MTDPLPLRRANGEEPARDALGKPHADLRGIEGGRARRADEGHEDEQSGSRTIHEHPLLTGWPHLRSMIAPALSPTCTGADAARSRRAPRLSSRNPRAGRADDRRAAFWLHRSAANRAVAAHADSMSRARHRDDAPRWRVRGVASAAAGTCIALLEARLHHISRRPRDGRTITHWSGVDRRQPDAGRRSARADVKPGVQPGSTPGAAGSGTGPTVPPPPPAPAQPGSGAPTTPGRPGIGPSQVPPGLNQPPPGTTTAPSTVTPGTTQAPPGATQPTPGTQATPGTIAPGTPIPQTATPGTAPSGTSSLPSVGAGVTTQQVRSAQQALQGSGVNPGPIDGVIGPRTQQAVRDFQKRENLPQTGQLDAATLQKLGVSSM